MRHGDGLDGRHGPAATTAGLVAVAVAVGFGVLVHLLPTGSTAATAVDDVGQLLAPGLAAALSLRAARRSSGRDRTLWRWLAAACAAWFGGQAVWSLYELVLRVPPPFPSPADVGYLLFPVLAVVGLLRWHGGSHLSAGARDLIDGGLLAGALLMLSWKTTLGTVMAEGGWSTLGFALALAYPAGALVSATVVLLLIARTGVSGRPHVVLLGAGLLSLAAADSAYVYLVAVGSYATGNVISAGWVGGFLLLAAAAAAARNEPALVSDRRLPAHGLFALPYVAVAIALGSVITSGLLGMVVPPVEILLAAALIGLLLVRQYLVVRDNDRLLVQLQAREAALAHEVMHDGLTGLSNRAMMLSRLDQVLALHARDGRGLVVLYCDLDGFKAVNDSLGHLAGDVVLREVAERLRACLRTSDTVARLSGDEFAVLLEPPHDDPLQVAGRVIDAVATPFEVDGVAVTVGVSVGLAVLPPGPGQVVEARALIGAADAAMYSAKSGGKNRAVLVEVGETPAADGAPPRATAEPAGAGPG
ncbi:diguanylate cyclase domain-containing protein [Jannaschia sp. R86511]|uniref:diguanylate cyclase domain-containing protein n=1 Tax=Jannaschia sp. R86511 TaxID=3093853 RepID=UPI0036D409E1